MTRWFSTAVVALALMASAPAPAVMPVIDAQSVAQLRQQLAYWRQQLNSMRDQAQTLRSQLQGATGARGMGSLLGLSPGQRNYLPTSDLAAADVLSGSSRFYPALGATLERYLREQSVLPDTAIAKMSASERNVIRDRRTIAAANQGIFATALAAASDRYAALQTLIDQIDRSVDNKAILDLQGRMAGEQLMLDNERAKLASLAAWGSARAEAAARRAAEAALVEQGTFGSRFHPGQR
jgi:type IV secretion system protein VirB5